MRICELFTSIQGEGLTLGRPSLFIRTGKCSVGCKFCDTKYSWDSGRDYSIGELVSEVEKASLPYLVLTGGEPLEEKELPELLRELSRLPFLREITVETCGFVYRELPKEKLYLVLSPKPPSMGVDFKGEEVLKFLKGYRERVELKFTFLTDEDLNLIEDFLFSYRELIPQPIVLQPLQVPFKDYTETVKELFELVVDRRELLNSFEVRLIPQVHKLVGLR
jgi:7-carboxy-7-deazaguanine synthase